MKIVIVDYGMGNIKSIKSTLEYIGVTDIEISDKADVLLNADRIILPGVGSYGKAMKEIKERKLDSYLKHLALIKSSYNRAPFFKKNELKLSDLFIGSETLISELCFNH